MSVQGFNMHSNPQRWDEAFKVKIGTQQACMLSCFLFLLVIDWVTKQSMDGKGTGIHWLSGKV